MRILIVLFILSGCGYNNTQIPSDATTSGTGGKNGAVGVLDFAAVKAQVFQSYCIRCHSQAGGNKAGVNLESYLSVKPIVQTIMSAVNNQFMPPSGTLPGTAKNLLVSWVQAGAPEFSTGSSGDSQNPSPLPTPVPCEKHHRMIDDEQIANLDEQSFYDFQLVTLKRRHDDCDDDINKNVELKINEGN